MMKTIAITGGKGGVGKSTMAILLANKLLSQGKKIVLADLDVECPNDYLLLKNSSENELKKPVEKVFAQFPYLDKTKCKKCGLCVQKCRFHAIFAPPNRTRSGSGQSPGQYPIFLPELCSGCRLCANICPYQAITMKKKVTGKIYQEKIAVDFYLVTGKSKAVLEETGPVVTKTRQYAETLGKKMKADYLLLDTAAGMHCSVIRGLLAVDLVYAVTEPTPLGAHDLELILQLIHKLKLPVKIILNQADLGKKELVEKIAKEKRVEIKYRIPYSRKLVEAYSKGKLQEIDIL